MANFFPRWVNRIPWVVIPVMLVLGIGLVTGAWHYFTPKYSRVGYTPDQPIPFDHQLHTSQVGLDCRYCHSFVESSGHSNLPSSATCWNCHEHIKKESPLLKPLRESVQTGKPIAWTRIHHPPDYVYFNHAVHINRGVSCVSCHGQVNEMKKVSHAKPHSMGWCLDCHRSPEKHLRPLEHVFDLNWKPEPRKNSEGKELSVEQTQIVIGKELKEQWGINPSESCSACHR